MVQSISHLCLEAHKHKGTTFQGTQISTQRRCTEIEIECLQHVGTISYADLLSIYVMYSVIAQSILAQSLKASRLRLT
jgi:hypothetical protein